MIENILTIAFVVVAAGAMAWLIWEVKRAQEMEE